MILNVQNLTKSFDGKDIIKKINFFLEDNEKMAIVGINGSGKSTLLKCIMKEYEPDEGQVIFGQGKTVGYLSQHPNIDNNLTVFETMEAAKQEVIDLETKMRETENAMKHLQGEELEKAMNSYSNMTERFERLEGYRYKSDIYGVLKGLKFNEEDYTKPVKVLSGGQKTRVTLGQLLLSHPDLIILDEPTNHLDMESICWLEQFLAGYKGSVIVVSHDRYFLDKVVTKILDIDMGVGTVFTGNYKDFSVKKAELRKARLNAYNKQQAEIKHQEQVIDKLKQFNREKSIKRAESRIKQLDKIERLEKPTEINSEMRLKLEASMMSGNDVLEVNELTKGFDGKTLFENIDFNVYRGEKVAIIGLNGTGKTTILKIINKHLKADNGRVKLGSKVKIGYYDQANALLTDSNTIFEELSNAYPDLNNTKVRNVLAAFLFTGDDVFKTISSLSGGEKGRVNLAKLMLSGANFLILDEPTNHLDMDSKEILEDAIREYDGTLLYVSHDRYFINQTATRILELKDKTLYEYKGNFDYYLEKKAEISGTAENAGNNNNSGNASNSSSSAGGNSSVGSNLSAGGYSSTGANSTNAASTSDTSSSASNNTSNAVAGSKEDYKAKKEEQARLRKIKNDIKKVEDKIAALEEKAEALDAELLSPEIASNSAKLMELSTERGNIDTELEELYAKWEELSLQE